MKKNKNFKKIMTILVSIVVVFGIIIVFSYNNTVKKPLKIDGDTVSVEVKTGEGFYNLLNTLEEKDLLNNKIFIKIYTKLHGANADLIPGIYELNKDITLEELIKTLQTEDYVKNSIKVTIPEGYNVDQIAQELEESQLFTKEEFLKAVKDYTLPSYITSNPNKRYAIEGFLYPETYMFPKDATANEVVDLMIKRFDNSIKSIEREIGIDIKDNELEKIITIASLIEEEARSNEDRPLIASVINNRIDKGMKLQIDACILYSMGKHVEVVLNKHLETDSPYNTYKYYGLPIGPIASPGKESIEAALKPAKTDYLFYLIKPGDTLHYFTNNYDDFLVKKKEFGL